MIIIIPGYVAVGVYHELGKVPLDVMGDTGGLVEERAGRAAVFVGVLGGVTVDILLVEHGELDAVGLFGPGVDCCIGAWFLFAELVARKSKDFKS